MYSWIKNIAFYLIIVSAIFILLPNSQYKKYIKLFIGMVLVLLLIEPALSFLNLKEHLNYYFNSFSTLWEVDEGTLDFDAIEEKSYKKVLEQYRTQIETQINNLANNQHLSIINCNIILNEEKDSPDYGTIKKIDLKVVENNSNESKRNLDIAPVVVDDIKIETSIDNDVENNSNENNNVNDNIEILKEKIMMYYPISKENIVIS